MGTAPDKIPDNFDFAAEELLEAPSDQRPAMLEGIAKALTRRLLQDNPAIGIREVSERVTAFIKAVRARLE
jgi:CRP-like cAMP-binding protein